MGSCGLSSKPLSQNSSEVVVDRQRERPSPCSSLFVGYHFYNNKYATIIKFRYTSTSSWHESETQKTDDLYPNLEQTHHIPSPLFRFHYCMQHAWRDLCLIDDDVKFDVL
jgi:hypothetical protein